MRSAPKQALVARLARGSARARAGRPRRSRRARHRKVRRARAARGERRRARSRRRRVPRRRPAVFARLSPEPDPKILGRRGRAHGSIASAGRPSRKTKAKRRCGACGRWPTSSCKLYAERAAQKKTPLPDAGRRLRGVRGQLSRSRKRATRRRPSPRSSCDLAERRRSWIAWCAATWASARPRSRCVPRS